MNSIDESTPLLKISENEQTQPSPKYSSKVIEFNILVVRYLLDRHILPELNKNTKLAYVKYNSMIIEQIIEFICKNHHFDENERIIQNNSSSSKYSKMKNYFDQSCMLDILKTALMINFTNPKIVKNITGIYFYFK